MAKRPISAFGLNRAMTNFAKSGAHTFNPRFRVKILAKNPKRLSFISIKYLSD
jgi:hypothetical protein